MIKQLETALPQLIPQSKLDMSVVNKWTKDATRALRLGRNISKHKLDPEDTEETLYNWAKSSVSGAWFISLDGESIDYIYAYQAIKLDRSGGHKASEALAYLFNSHVRGVTRPVFFNHLLPAQRFVVTDFIYTPDGHRWFEAEYNEAFRRNYNVYAIDLTGKPTGFRISKEQFWELKSLYWGKDKEHQKYRFAIELP